MEKLIWTEFLVTIGSALLVAFMYPWLGDAAAGGFGLMGLMVFGAFFIKRRNVVVDERDRKIEQEARWVGVAASWMVLLLGVIASVFWANVSRSPVSIRNLNWLIWISIAVCMGGKGLSGLLAYRRGSHAS
jgi:hypothetical protein